MDKASQTLVALQTPPLAHYQNVGVQNKALSLKPILDSGYISLRFNAEDETILKTAEGILEASLPLKVGQTSPSTTGPIICLSPDEWALLVPSRQSDLAARLQLALCEYPALVVDLSDQFAVIEASGTKAWQLLQKAIPLDLHVSQFKPGMAARTLAAKAGVLLYYKQDGSAYRLYTRRSFAQYLWAWLSDASLNILE